MKYFIKGLKEIVNICEKYNIEMTACECCNAIHFDYFENGKLLEYIDGIYCVEDLKEAIKRLEKEIEEVE